MWPVVLFAFDSSHLVTGPVLVASEHGSGRLECISCGKPRVFVNERRLFQCGTENIEFQCGEPLFSEDFTVTSAEHADFDLQKEFFKRFVVWRLFCIKLLSTSFVVAAELTCQKTRLFLDDIERMKARFHTVLPTCKSAQCGTLYCKRPKKRKRSVDDTFEPDPTHQ